MISALLKNVKKHEGIFTMSQTDALSREELLGMLRDFARNWLAHDGLWFQAVEQRFGMEAAISCDRDAWEAFTRIEAKRIKRRHDIAEHSGLEGLKQALDMRLYAFLNEQEVVDESGSGFTFRMNTCRVQDARKRKGLPDFPCRDVGLVEYAGFASTIDPRIQTSCECCPPDEHPEEYYCSWRFELKDIE